MFPKSHQREVDRSNCQYSINKKASNQPRRHIETCKTGSLLTHASYFNRIGWLSVQTAKVSLYNTETSAWQMFLRVTTGQRSLWWSIPLCSPCTSWLASKSVSSPLAPRPRMAEPHSTLSLCSSDSQAGLAPAPVEGLLRLVLFCIKIEKCASTYVNSKVK